MKSRLGLIASPTLGTLGVHWLSGLALELIWKALLIGFLFAACFVAFSYCLARE